MEDKILDDDDIIDLTDLLEEGQPPGEKEETADKGDSAVRMNEPDSFDLGKEISMEYDVSVEEIEGGGEPLDIDAELSSNEEEALVQEDIGDEETITLEDTGESIELELTEDSSAPVEEIDFSSSDEQDFSGKAEVETVESPPAAVEQDEATLEEGETLTEFTAGEPDIFESTEEVRADMTLLEEAAPSRGADDVIAEIRQEVPNMIEGIVRPFMAELVHEIISASREQLPGIVEKIIREEIDKLKKLNG